MVCYECSCFVIDYLGLRLLLQALLLDLLLFLDVYCSHEFIWDYYRDVLLFTDIFIDHIYYYAAKLTSFSPAPSQLKASDIQSKRASGILAATPEILFGFKYLNSNETVIKSRFVNCANRVFQVHAAFAPQSEIDVSAFTAAVLQEYEKNPRMKWFHQVQRRVKGKIDIVAMKEVASILSPRLIIEVSVDSVMKSPQLFGYITNSFATDEWAECADVLLGATMTFGGSICLSAFYKVLEGGMEKVAAVTLFEGMFNADTLSRVLSFVAQ